MIVPVDTQPGTDSAVAQVSRKCITVLMVYEDTLTGLLAKRMADCISTLLGPRYEFNLVLQRLEHLTDALATGRAEPQKDVADIVLVSVYGNRPWPAAFEKCMVSWVGEHTARHGGLAALLVNSTAANGCRAALEQAARERGWDFYSCLPPSLRLA